LRTQKAVFRTRKALWRTRKALFADFMAIDAEKRERRRRKIPGTNRKIKEPKMVLQRDAIEDPFLVPERTFQTRIL